MTKRIWASLALGVIIVVGVIVVVFFQGQSSTEVVEPVVTTVIEVPVSTDLEGVVMTVGGQPIAQATVSATAVLEESDDTIKPVNVKTDQSGRFVFKGLTSGQWSLDAQAKGFVSPGPRAIRGQKVMIKKGKRPATLELVLRQPVQVHGQVVAAGKPIAGAQIGLFYKFADGVGGPLKQFALDRVATTDKQGYFKLNTIAPGRFRVLVEAKGFEMTQSRELFLKQGRDIKGLIIDLAPSASIVFDVVSQKGQPLQASITLENRALLNPIQRKADQKGQVRFDRLPAGRFKVTAQLKGFAREVLQVDAVANKVIVRDVVMNKASGLFGRVIFPEGTSRKRALVVLMDADGKRIRTIYTDREGVFQLERVPKNLDQIQAVSSTLAPSKVMTVTLGREHELSMGKGGGIKGKVVTSNGKPLLGYSIAVESMKMDTPRAYGRRAIRPQTNRQADGRFELSPLAPGTYTLRVQPVKGYASATSASIVVRSEKITDGVVITVGEGATVSGVVTDKAGPVAGARVALFNTMSRFGSISTATDSDGKYTLKHVTSGRQSLRVSKRGYLTQIVAGVETDTNGSVSRDVVLEKAKPGERFAFHGIGASLQRTKRGIIIQNTMENMPAQTYGLKAKDLIVGVDGEETTDMELMDVIKRIRGQEGVSVSIEVEREGEGRMTIDVERGRVVVKSRSRRTRTPRTPRTN